MHYIIFDMEWNQPRPGARMEYIDDRCLKNEIMQIGAVKTDEKANILDTFTVNIHPQKFRTINKNVRKLTGLTEEELEDAPIIDDAIDMFREFCGEDFVFVTWGYDDISVLGSNLAYFRIDTDWIPKCYNLQMIFCAQVENEKKQYSLSHAAEHFGIEPSEDMVFHNALADAYYTAKVAACLDLSGGIDRYGAMVFKDKSVPEHMKNIRYIQSYHCVKGYDRVMQMTAGKKAVCPDCGKVLAEEYRASHGEFDFLFCGNCPEHGSFVYIYRLHKNDDVHYSGEERCFGVTQYNADFFRRKADELANADDIRHKKLAAKRRRKRERDKMRRHRKKLGLFFRKNAAEDSAEAEGTQSEE